MNIIEEIIILLGISLDIFGAMERHVFLGNASGPQVFLAMVLTLLEAVIGMYTGYHLGYEHKMKSYVLGGLLLLAGSADVVIRHIL